MQSSNIKQIIAEDQLVSYRVFGGGNENGPELLLLHGWGSDSRCWYGVINACNDEVSSIYTIDLPGFGDSENPREDFSPEDYARVVKAFIKRLGLNNIVVVGHSFGGRVAARLSDGSVPEVRSLVLVGSSGVRENIQIKKGVGFVSRLFKRVVPKRAKKKLYKLAGSDYTLRPDLEGTFRKSLAIDDTLAYSHIQIPTLLIWGRDDKAVPVSIARSLNEVIPQSTLTVIDSAGHYVFNDSLPQFCDSLRQFISS